MRWLKTKKSWLVARKRWSGYLFIINHQLLLGCCMWFQDITHFLLCISKPPGPPPSLSLIHSRWAQWDIWFSVQRHMYTAVSACLKQLAWSSSTTAILNHAFVYVIKIKKPKPKTMCSIVLSCRLIRYFSVLQILSLLLLTLLKFSKCSWYNDMQVIQIMCKLQKVFQVCVNTHDSSPSE